MTSAFAASQRHRWARLIGSGGRALLRVSIYIVVVGGRRVYVILNILLIFLEIVRLLCVLVR